MEGVDLGTLATDLPRSVRKSGITPLDDTNPKCQGANDTEALADPSNDQELVLDCYAWVAISPFAENTIDSIDLTIPKGIGFSGRINLFDRFEVEVEAQVSKGLLYYQTNRLPVFLMLLPCAPSLMCLIQRTRASI